MNRSGKSFLAPAMFATALVVAGVVTGPVLAIDVAAGGPGEVGATVGSPGMADGLTLSPLRMVALEVGVVTVDGVEIGTVSGLETAADGETLIIVAVANAEEDVIAGIASIAVRLSSVAAESSIVRQSDNPADARYQYLSTEWQVVIQTDSADLMASIAAAF